MIKFQIIFYSLIFLLAFGRFFPVFYAPEFLHEFFSSWGFVLSYFSIAPLLIFLIYLVSKSFFGKKTQARQSLVCISLTAIYILLLFLTPVFIEISHKIVIAVNKERAVENFANPILGQYLTIDNACKFGATYTRHPDDERGTIITSGVRQGTIISRKPCESINYAEFTSNEMGLTETKIKLLYFPVELAQTGLKHQSADEKKDYGNGWYYMRRSAALRLF